MVRKVVLRMGKIMLRRKEVTSLVLRTVAPGNRAVFLVGWLCKVVTLRYGGIKAYRAALPFFVGLILGDYVIASLWTLWGSATGLTMYRCFPN